MRKRIADTSFTHFLYLEDDIRVTKKNLIYWINARNSLRNYKYNKSGKPGDHELYEELIRIVETISDSE